MTTNMKPIHPDIPTDRAWKAGRRLYVRCGYKSQLNDGLRKIGAHWDGEQRALWVGSGKRDQVVELVQAAEVRIQQIKDVKAQRRWVQVPYEASGIRSRVKELGGIWDAEIKCWAMPDEQTEAEILGLLKQEREKIIAQAQAAKEAAQKASREGREAAKAAEAARAEKRQEQVIAASGRTLTGETATVTQVSTRRMNRRTAEDTAWPVGHLVKLRDGRRGIVTDVEVWFTDDESASSTCWHPETHDEAHWDLRHEVAIVEPTEDEQQADAEARAEREDAAEIYHAMEAAYQLTESCPRDWSHTPVEEIAATITVNSPGGMSAHGGKIILTRDNRVIYQHPGWYDDWTHVEGRSRRPEVAARYRNLAARGTRTRVHSDGQMAYTYRVEVTGE